MAAGIKNPFAWVEIYVGDMNRAQKFYEAIFEIQFSEIPMGEEGVGSMQMLCFPWVENERGASGALVKMEGFTPGPGGTLVYFSCDDCAVEESRVEKAGGTILQPKMAIGEHGFCAVIMDTEGNSIGLYSM